MINYIWASIVVVSVLFAFASGNENSISSGVLEGATNAINLIISMCAMMCLWSGVMNIADKSGVTTWFARLFSPVLKIIMPEYKYDKNVIKAVSMNVSANILGIGNASTPLGIEAMRRMNNSNNCNSNRTIANNSMIVFVIINTASIQIVPTMVAVLRQNNGSQNPFNIAPCVWISSIFSVVIGVSLAKVMEKFC